MAHDEDSPGRGRGKYAAAGVEQTQEEHLAALQAAVEDIDARLDALENPPTPEPPA